VSILDPPHPLARDDWMPAFAAMTRANMVAP
jgi:hypothetical protein